jgi:hypothetical protein
LADARHLPHGRSQAGDRHLKFHETRDNLSSTSSRPKTDVKVDDEWRFFDNADGTSA